MTFHDTSLERAAQAMTPAGGPGYSPGAMTDISSATIAELGRALRAGRVTARGLLEQALANRSEALGAYKLWMPDQAARAADLADAAFAQGLDFGPLQGLPVSVKDLFGLAGAPTHAGAPKPLPASWEAEGPVVAAVRNGLAVVTGKTHTVEFAFGGVGSNPHWGTPRNPWGGESHRVPGGSSAGAGVSLLEGTAVVALGSDTAGSVRVPASFTGTVGLKTSYGRWSLRGIVPLSPSLDTAGVLTRSVADAALAFAAIDPVCRTPPEPADPARLRLGVIESLFEDCGPGVAETVRAALAELEDRGVTVESFDLPEMADARAVFAEGGLAVPEFVAFIENELPDFKATLDPNVRGRFEAFGALTSTEYLGRRMRLARAAAAANARLAGIDAIVGPTTPITAPLLQHAAEGEGYRTHNMAALRNTMPGNLLELCGLTIPAGLDGSGMPVGLQLLAPLGTDERLISIGLAVEGIIGPASRRLGTPPGK